VKKTLTPGISAETRHRVVTENLVSFRRGGAPPVLCTPWLLHFMETAAYEAVQPHLEQGEGSVGYGFDFKHLAPTPAGDTVVSTAIVTAVEGNLVTLQIEAHDSKVLIAKGQHTRAVIDLDRFKRRLKKREK